MNVVLDVLLARRPHLDAGAAAWAAVETGHAERMLAAHTLPAIYYLYRKTAGAQRARTAVSALLRVFQVAAIDAPVLQAALHLPCPDYEDALSAAAARLAGCGYIVTRNAKDFRNSLVPPLSPEALVLLIRPNPPAQLSNDSIVVF